ncbi:MAG: hypothetical protein ACRBF0_01350 [Calditrichia bacterium]
MKLTLSLMLIVLVGCSGSSKLSKASIENDQLIVFVKDKGSIVLTNATGQFEKKIYESDHQVLYAAWSNNDSLIVFWEKNEEENDVFLKAIRTAELPTETAQTIVSDAKHKFLKFNFVDNDEIVYCDLAGLVHCDFVSKRHRFVKDTKVESFEYSKVLHAVFFSNDSALMKVNLKTKQVLKLVDSKDKSITNISVSQDGTRLFYAKESELYVIETTAPYRVLSQQKLVSPVYWVTWIGSEEVLVQAGHITKNHMMSNKNFLEPTRRSKRSLGSMAFYRFNLSSGLVQKVFNKSESVSLANPSLSANKKYLTFVSNTLKSTRKVHLLSLAEGKAAQISKKGLAYSPGWQNTNQKVLTEE